MLPAWIVFLLNSVVLWHFFDESRNSWQRWSVCALACYNTYLFLRIVFRAVFL